MKEFKSFNATTVSLEGSNLIEASAGTGKTYSIAILVLRLILEKEVSIKEVLMVTFTKAAVAELEERVRLFIRLAFKVSQGETINDGTISEIVTDVMASKGEENVQSLLKDAVLFLDETSVLTIHSFCQQTLGEFAFETRQLFGAELMQDAGSLLEEEVNSFWRKHITIIPTELLAQLLNTGLSRAVISQVVNGHISGKRYLAYQKTEDYSFCNDDYLKLMDSLKDLISRENEFWSSLLQYVVDEQERLEGLRLGSSHARKCKELDFSDPETAIRHIGSHQEKPQYIAALFPDVIERFILYDEVAQERKRFLKEILRRINCLAVNEVSLGIDVFKQINNTLSFDDLIANLHQALIKNGNPKLVDCLQSKYKAVFIDEFQDTDRLQYEIFRKAFNEKTILFFIGDPKQSIYAWRKADLFTYFEARNHVSNLYGMNQNFRSSEPLINAMNVFFKPDADFDTFHFQNADQAIEYIPVESPVSNTKGSLIYNNAVDVPFTISELPNKNELIHGVTAQVLDLLTNDAYVIHSKGENRKVLPADIGILVRSNSQGNDIKASLSRLGIPAVTIGDAKVLNSVEARYVLYLLEAMLQITRASINKALLSPFTGLVDYNLLSLDDELVTEHFRKYKARWEKDGIYTALNDFIADYGVKHVLLDLNTEAGERIITNLYQLIELLHKVQSNKKLNPLELISWLKRGMEGMETEGDEYEQRIENDEEAVNIVTIHKSKGLEYNIVLAPFLDLLTTDKHKTCSFRDLHSQEYVSAEKDQLNDIQRAELERQLEQENRRLIYVAVTRAVYKCFIFKNAYYKNSSIAQFVNACRTVANPLIRFNSAVPAPEISSYSRSEKIYVQTTPKPVDFHLLQQNWRKMSYSMLRADHETSIKNRSNTHLDHYDDFIFSQLTKGAKTGNLLHFIFENVHFSDSAKWKYVIDNAIERFSPSQIPGLPLFLHQMLEHVMHAEIKIGDDSLKLASVTAAKCIHEFEFDFTVSSFKAAVLENLADENMHIEVRDFQQLEGVMNGKIDLFFEKDGKYYVLDWKSNFLGDSLEYYDEEAVATAMNENNYHLQHLLYTVAVKKYLDSRLPDFDYETQFGGVIYLFVRGVRNGSNSGVFAYKAPVEKIESLGTMLSGAGVEAYI